MVNTSFTLYTKLCVCVCVHDTRICMANLVLVECECVESREQGQGERGIVQTVVVQNQLLQTTKLLHSNHRPDRGDTSQPHYTHTIPIALPSHITL